MRRSNGVVQMTGYEKSDANIDLLIKMAAGVAVLVIVALTGVAIMWRVFAYSTVYTDDMAGSPLAPMRTLPPPPRLQTTPASDLKEVREAEAELLGNYAWIDKSKGVVRIPIDRAMDLLAERGLPAGKPEKPEAKK